MSDVWQLDVAAHNFIENIAILHKRAMSRIGGAEILSRLFQAAPTISPQKTLKLHYSTRDTQNSHNLSVWSYI
jgi:hypothetical protein